MEHDESDHKVFTYTDKVFTYPDKDESNKAQKKAEAAARYLNSKGFAAAAYPKPVTTDAKEEKSWDAEKGNEYSVRVAQSQIYGLSPGDGEIKDYLLAVYNDASADFRRNESGGDARVNLYITLATAVMGGLIALAFGQPFGSPSTIIPAVVVGALVVIIIGSATLLRIIKRNTDTDKYIGVMKDVGTYFVLRHPEIHTFVNVHDPLRPKERRADSTNAWSLDTGGLLQTVAILNSMVVASVPLLILLTFYVSEIEVGRVQLGLLVLASLLLALLVWCWQMLGARDRYRKLET